jgi:hypothetical protein
MKRGAVPIGAVERGAASVRGRVEADETVTAPISGRPCVAWRVTAIALSAHPRLLFDRGDWARGLRVSDATGQLGIDAGGMALDFTTRCAVEIAGKPRQDELPPSWLALCEEEGVSPWPEEPWRGRTVIIEGALPQNAEINARGRVERVGGAPGHPYREAEAALRLRRGEDGGEISTARPGQILPGLGAVAGLGATAVGLLGVGLVEAGGLVAILAALAAAWVGHPEPDLLSIWRVSAPARRSLLSELQGGPAAARGVVEPLGEPAIAPLSGRACVAYEISLWQEEAYLRYPLLQRCGSARALSLRDSTGRAEVSGEAEVRLSRRGRAAWRGGQGEPLPLFLRPLLAAAGVDVPRDGRAPFAWRAEERVLLPGEEAQVTGWATLEGAERKITPRPGMRLRLSNCESRELAG